MKDNQIIPVEIIGNKILLIRGQKVMLDKDLAQLYFIARQTAKQNLLISEQGLTIYDF